MTLRVPRITLVAGGVVVTLWLAITYVVYCTHSSDVTKAGPFGDMFGAVNALFTGLAFVGVLTQLHQQQQQIAENRLETQRLRKEERATKEAFNKATYATSYTAAREILQEERVRDSRKTVITVLSHIPLKDWTAEQRAVAEVVCHTYDTVAIMVSLGLLPVHYIADHWGDGLRKCWKVLDPFVADWRRSRGSMEIWDDFESLARASEKFHKKSWPPTTGAA